MPRLEIELTSSRPDGTWTWRAAGARQPKGTLDGALLQPGARVGDVVRAECEIDLDGTRVTAVLPPRATRSEPDRLPLLGPGREPPPLTHDGGAPDVRDRPRREGRREGRTERRDGRPGGRPPERPEGSRPSRERGAPGPTGRPPGDRARRAPAERRERGPRAQPDRTGTSGGAEREGPSRGRPRPPGPRRPAPSAPEARPRPKRLNPGRAHRDAVLAGLSPEQRPVAEQVLRGGLPAVRHAVEEQNARARQEGAPEVRADALVAMAESLLPRLRAAEWRDRAEAAASGVDEISLRDLRAVVAGADSAGRDEESRALAARLREALERRSAEERESWMDEIRRSLADGRVVRALRVSGRPPEPGVRFPADLAEALGAAAGEAMSADTAPDRWAALLDAVLTSPVRRVVRPRGLPAERDPEFERALRLAAPRVPALATLLGGLLPPPPGGPGPGPGGRRRPAPGGPPRRRPTVPSRPPAPHAPPPAPPPGSEKAAPAVPEATSGTPEATSGTPEATSGSPEATSGGAEAAPADTSPPPTEGGPGGDEAPPLSGDDGDDPVLVQELG